MAVVNISLESEDDVYFGISCTILSYNKKEEFLVEDIVQELKETYNWSQHVFERWNIEEMIEISIKNLIEHGRIIEEARYYKLAEKK